MRLFVAVELPATALRAATQVSEALRQRVVEAAPRARLTWIPPERLHLTVRFIGEAGSDRAAAIVEALSAPFATPAFAFSLSTPGAFSTRGAPGVLWLGVDSGADELRQLEQDVSSRLEDIGVPREHRPYTPHLTLARVRDPQTLRVRALLDGLVTPDHAPGLVDAITLFESRLSPKGPTYAAIHRTRLRQA
jgi:2'-5' RNA ligase